MIFIVLLTGLFSVAGPAAFAQDIHFSKDRQVKKLLRTGKVNEVQGVINSIFKSDSKKSKKDDEPIVAEGTEFDDSYLDGKRPRPSDSIEYYFLTGLHKHYLFEKENTKLYLKNKPDTVAYFSRLYEMMDALDHCFPELSVLKREETEAKGLIQQYKDNLGRGGNYYLAKKDMKTAFKFFHKYVSMADRQLFTTPDSLLNRALYNTAYVASQLKDYETVLKYGSELLRRGEVSEEADMLVCEALSEMKRVDEWKEALKQAVNRHPESFFFYAELIDYYIENNASEKALDYADELVKNDPMSGLKNFVKGYVYQHIGKYSDAIIWMEVCDRLDSKITENMSALGFCYVSLAEEFDASLRGNRTTPEAREQLQKYYQKAKEYLEICRSKAPDNPQYWAPALYKVYYNLNDGDKLDEMEKILNKMAR